MKRVRCAVYTRKSTEDGLKQEFNSLHAQREACEAYILSQKHEGWQLVPTHYDGGGFSGANMQRPGLKALLAAVDAGLADVIVVYKVDRLTRSLADFAKIVERLDAKGASFVSVTQAFNTTTSMGRLTLNVLLSFAQFEREVTGERIRDKINASKKKELWMGGPVPLGYEVVERKLVPVAAEAEQVRHIMRRNVESTSASALIVQLEQEGIRTKVQRRTSGPHRGGIAFRRGSLFHLLKNPVYRGMIVHKGKNYPGEHKAIVDKALWEAVQARLAAKAPPRRRPTNDQQDALLEGLLTDSEGRPMVPSFTCKGMRRYRYYERRRDLVGAGRHAATPFAKRSLDRHIVDELRKLLADENALRRWTRIEEAGRLQAMIAQAAGLERLLASENASGDAVRSLVGSIQVRADGLDLAIAPAALGLNSDGDALPLKLTLPTRKPFRETKLRLGTKTSSGSSDTHRALIKLLREAHQVREQVLAASGEPLSTIATRHGRCRKQMAKLIRLSWLSPRITEALVGGALPDRFNRKHLLEMAIPTSWSEQHRMFGLR